LNEREKNLEKKQGGAGLARTFECDEVRLPPLNERIQETPTLFYRRCRVLCRR
jgi:hypothetical protein